MKWIVSVFALLVLASPAMAAMDSAAFCDEMATQVGGDDKLVLDCLKQEKEAKDSLAAMQVPEKTLTFCTTVAGAVGGSYKALADCVDKELNPQVEAPAEPVETAEAAAPAGESAAKEAQ
ncbi:MAG: hypothetical protein RRB13_12620 [bacterium]|nr:hypothetical protein [bacterium]